MNKKTNKNITKQKLNVKTQKNIKKIIIKYKKIIAFQKIFSQTFDTIRFLSKKIYLI